MPTQERLTPPYLSCRRGMALYLVLAVLIITVLIAGMFLNLTLSQSRLTHHTVSRTQAYYAARLGMCYAIEMLSSKEPGWDSSSEFNFTICRIVGPGCNRIEHDLPASINNITINVRDATEVAPAGTRRFNVTVDYQYLE